MLWAGTAETEQTSAPAEGGTLPPQMGGSAEKLNSYKNNRK